MTSTEAPASSEEEKFLEHALKAFKTIRKNLEAKSFEAPVRAAIGALLLADAVLETEDEDSHPRNSFMDGVDLLNTAFALLEGDDDAEGDPGAATS